MGGSYRASSGIGLEFARQLARRGHPVLAIARGRERLAALAKEAAEHAGRIELLSADLATEEGLALVSRRVDELAEIELLINNAGVHGRLRRSISRLADRRDKAER